MGKNGSERLDWVEKSRSNHRRFADISANLAGAFGQY